MMRDEFENRVAEIVGKAVYTKPSSADWITINQVYTFHPAIKNVGGQQQIAKIYVELGMAVINDMAPRAEKLMDLESKRFQAQAALNAIDAEIAELSKG